MNFYFKFKPSLTTPAAQIALSLFILSTAIGYSGCGKIWGGVSATATGGTPATGAALSAYTGTNWNDYIIANNGGSTVYNQPNVPCVGTENGYAGCIHAGEIRKIPLPSLTSCTNLTAVDALGAFTWVCDASSGSVAFYSTGLNSGKNLRDLITTAGWKTNYLQVSLSGVALTQSAPAVWWNKVGSSHVVP